MTHAEFQKLIKIHRLRGRSVEACRRVLVGGETAYAAAADLGLARSTLSRALARLNRKICRACGQPLTESD